MGTTLINAQNVSKYVLYYGNALNTWTVLHPHPNPTQEFFHCTELLALVMHQCSWSTLMALAKVNQRARAIVQDTIRIRVRTFVGHFLPPKEHVDLFGMLKIIRGVIVGPVVRCIMSTDVPAYRDVNPRQLEIIVGAHSSYSMLHSFFQRLGYGYRFPMH